MMRSSCSVWILVTLLLWLHPKETTARTVTVGPTDNVQAAIDALQPGDTLRLTAGIYQGPFTVQVSGTPTLPIVITSASVNFEEQAIIDGGAARPGAELRNHWLEFANASWIEVSYVQFQNGWTDPIPIESASYLSLRHCDFVGGRRVIRARGSATHHILVENCFWDQGGRYLWDIDRWEGENAWEAMHHGALRFFNGSLFAAEGTSGGHVLRGNTIQHAFNALRWRADQGMDKNMEIYENTIQYIRDNDFEPEDYAANLFIHHNNSHNVHKTLSIDNVNGGNIYYFGNVITTDRFGRAGNIATGYYKIYGENQNVSEPIYIFNNSFFGTGRVHGSIEDRSIVNVVHLNNAYELTRRRWELNQWNETLVYDYDCSNEPFSQVLTDNGQEVHGLVAEPGYQDGVGQNLKLNEDSPCIDAGTAVAIPSLSWQQSFVGSAPDIGAYDGNEPMVGPFFRAEGTETLERPRISLVTRDQDSTSLSFSTALDPSSVAGNIFFRDASQAAQTVSQFVLKDNDHTLRFANPGNKGGAYSVKNELRGKNGNEATDWANYDEFQPRTADDLVAVLLSASSGGRIVMNQARRIFQRGTQIELSAVPEPGYQFVEWDGDLSSVQDQASVVLENSMWIVAKFEEEETPLSIGQEDSDITVYPHPSDGYVSFTNSHVIQLLEAFDITGRKLQEISSGFDGEVNLGLSEGLYLLRISTEKGVVNRKLMINQQRTPR